MRRKEKEKRGLSLKRFRFYRLYEGIHISRWEVLILRQFYGENFLYTVCVRAAKSGQIIDFTLQQSRYKCCC